MFYLMKKTAAEDLYLKISHIIHTYYSLYWDSAFHFFRDRIKSCTANK